VHYRLFDNDNWWIAAKLSLIFSYKTRKNYRSKIEIEQIQKIFETDSVDVLMK